LIKKNFYSSFSNQLYQKMVKINFELKKRYVYFLIGLFVIVGLGFVLAQTVPNPGHTSAQIALTDTVSLQEVASQLAAIKNEGDVCTSTNAECNLGVDVISGSGLTASASGGFVTMNVDNSVLQRRVGNSCPIGQAITAINETGGVTCASAGAGQWVGASGGPIFYTGGNVGIGTATPNSGTLVVRRSTAGSVFVVRNTADTADTFAVDNTGAITAGSVPWARISGFAGDTTSDTIADDGVINSAEVNFNYAGSSSKGGAATTATTAGSVPWGGITGMPAGFADGIDNTGAGSLSCHAISASLNDDGPICTNFLSCDYGTMTGGGFNCNWGTMMASSPYNNAWQGGCTENPGGGCSNQEIFVRCCTLS
jgi:hypothetical protein